MNSAEQRDRFPEDQRLRRHGFVIVSRPCQGEPVWCLGGDLFGQGGVRMKHSEALLRIKDGSK